MWRGLSDFLAIFCSSSAISMHSDSNSDADPNPDPCGHLLLGSVILSLGIEENECGHVF